MPLQRVVAILLQASTVGAAEGQLRAERQFTEADPLADCALAELTPPAGSTGTPAARLLRALEGAQGHRVLLTGATGFAKNAPCSRSCSSAKCRSPALCARDEAEAARPRSALCSSRAAGGRVARAAARGARRPVEDLGMGTRRGARWRAAPRPSSTAPAIDLKKLTTAAPTCGHA